MRITKAAVRQALCYEFGYRPGDVLRIEREAAGLRGVRAVCYSPQQYSGARRSIGGVNNSKQWQERSREEQEGAVLAAEDLLRRAGYPVRRVESAKT